MITAAVLGAGIAGLVAAYELERRGYDVVVLEADSRIGGRVFTRRLGGPDGPIVEFGAMRIPAGHQFTMRYVHDLGLRHRLRPFRGILSDPHNYLRIGSQLVRVRDAAAPLIRETEKYAGESCYRRDTLLFVGWLYAAQLVDGIAGRVRGPICTGKEIVGLDVRRDGVSVHVAGAPVPVMTYLIVLCTLPFSVLRELPLTGLSADKLDAITTLNYGSATKVALHCREAFLEQTSSDFPCTHQKLDQLYGLAVKFLSPSPTWSRFSALQIRENGHGI